MELLVCYVVLDQRSFETVGCLVVHNVHLWHGTSQFEAVEERQGGVPQFCCIPGFDWVDENRICVEIIANHDVLIASA